MENTIKSDFILGSSSQIRLEILKLANYTPKKIVKPQIDETPLKKEKPICYVERIAKEKAEYIQQLNNGENILSADTIVVANNKIIQKPKDFDEIKNNLKLFSNRNIKVITAIYFINKKDIHTAKIITTKIKFKHFNQRDIDDLLKYGCDLNCAGGVKVEGFMASMIKNINGEYTNILGMPLYEVRNIFISNGI